MSSADVKVPSPQSSLLTTPVGEKPKRGRLILSGIATVILVSVLILAVAWFTVTERHEALLNETEQRLTLAAEGRAEVLSTWLQATVGHSSRVAESDFFRIFATELATADGDLSGATLRSDLPLEEGEDPIAVPLLDQLPMLERILTDFTVSAGFESGYFVNLNGEPFLATAASMPLSESAKALATQAVETRKRTYGLPYSAPAGLLMDFAVPIISSQAEPQTGDVVASLVLTIPVAAGFAKALEPPPLAQPGERQVILLSGEGAFFSMAPGAFELSGPISLTSSLPDLARGLSFAQRSGVTTDEDVYSLAVPIEGPSWWIHREHPVRLVLAPLSDYKLAALGIAFLLLSVIAGLFVALWWRVTSYHNKALAQQYQDLAARIDAQKRFLDSITASVGEWIALKDTKGAYRFVNQAFADALGMDASELLGQTDYSLFPAATAERLLISDQRAQFSPRVITVSEDLSLPAGKRTFQISKIAYPPQEDERGEDAPPPELLMVARDVTEIVAAEKRREAAIRQMVTVLVRSIELRDPYLAGHSRRVAGFATAVAEHMGLPEIDQVTLEIAANLSQIGKLKVPRAVLTKPARLSEDEISEMNRHLDYAADVLRDIDFGLPVLETLMQMHERLDGSGYPNGLKQDEISPRARILAVCDVFCARIEPRGYRSVISTEEALSILASNAGRYDSTVVKSLKSVAYSVKGEKLTAELCF